jgi:hypothetical protein
MLEYGKLTPAHDGLMPGSYKPTRVRRTLMPAYHRPVSGRHGPMLSRAIAGRGQGIGSGSPASRGCRNPGDVPVAPSDGRDRPDGETSLDGLPDIRVFADIPRLRTPGTRREVAGDPLVRSAVGVVRRTSPSGLPDFLTA